MCNYKKRPMCEIEHEIKKYENSSSFKIKTVINVFKFLRFLNGDLFYFLFTLSIFLGTKFFLTNNFDGFIIMMLLHYLFFMKFFKPIFDRYTHTKEDNEETTKIINGLETLLNKKTPN